MTEPIRCHTFENGLVLLAEKNPSLESAAFSFLVQAGCCYDPPQRAGLSAFTCDMMLRGAGDRDNRKFVFDLEILGVERGESVGVTHSSFGGATVAENLPAALTIYADLLRRPQLPTDQLEAGRMVVLQELRAIEDDPNQKVMMSLRQQRYPDPWGRSSGGEISALKAITQTDIEEFQQKFYRPNATILATAGNIDWEQLKDRVAELFGDWKTIEVDKPTDGESLTPVKHLDYDSNQTHIAVAFPSAAYNDDDYFQARGAVGVLSDGMSSRLFTEVREKRGLCYSIYAANHSVQQRGSVLSYAGTSADRAQETLDVMMHEFTRLADGVTDKEVNSLKARLKSALIMMQESSASRAAAIARDWFLLKKRRTLAEVGEIVDALTADSISSYLKNNPPKDFRVVTLGPSPLEVPGGVS